MKGSCLCGDITVEAQDQVDIGLCHCSMCRKWTSGPMCAVHPTGPVIFSGETPRRYKSSEWAERGFCGNCGSTLFYYLVPADQYILSVGLFQDSTFTLTSEIFVDEKPEYYELKNNTEKLTGAEVFAKYS